MAGRKRKKEQAPAVANEPVAGYLKVPGVSGSSMEIKISSFEEQEQEMREYWASISPRKRLSNLIRLVQMAYGLTPEKLKNPRLKNIIHIIEPDEHFS